MTEQVPQSILLVTCSKQPPTLLVPPLPDLFHLIKLSFSERPKLDAVLQTQPHKCQIKGDNHLPHLADFTLTHAAWYVVGVHCRERAPLGNAFFRFIFPRTSYSLCPGGACVVIDRRD